MKRTGGLILIETGIFHVSYLGPLFEKYRSDVQNLRPKYAKISIMTKLFVN